MLSSLTIYFLLIFIPIIIVLIGINLPNYLNLTEEINIEKAPSVIFKYFADLQEFIKWSPWFKNAKNSRITYNDDTMTVGNQLKYKTTNRSFEKTIEISHLEINQKIILEIDFGLSKKGNIEINLVENEKDKTIIKWNFYLPLGNNPIERWFGLFIKHSFKKKLKKGLDKLKLKIENS